ncbi:neuroendocrine convertase 2 [Plakobranchus ocellatus]|uniref:Neuroendocrine convertase 2 n=1 Tax=Plakobranchus ocellatus TaxID=259542 RepID=A0AAV4CSP2_9GAST|nr:neuroendocrine convertase 2 [Plakobranchus ocellatus]
MNLQTLETDRAENESIALVLSCDLQVRTAFQQSGYMRVKRGFKQLEKVLALNKQKYGLKAKPNSLYSSIKLPNDPDFGKEWYLRNTGQSGGVEGLDLNVMEAWEMGYSGAGVTTAIMDDGIDYLHEDLKYNYVSISH